MYARTTTLTGDSGAIDAGIAHVRDEIMPALDGIEGYQGLSMLVDRDTGRCILTTAWDSPEALAASAGRASALRSRAAEIFGAGPVEVEEWEIAVLHRAHHSPEGACARVTWVSADPGSAEPAIQSYKSTTLPAVEQLDGFLGASLLLNRATGRAVSTVTFESHDAMQRTRSRSDAVRARGAAEAAAQVLDVAELDLVLAHLHVPELV